MAKNNPSNPYSTDSTSIQREVHPPLAKAVVDSAYSHPDDNGFHIVNIKIKGESAPQPAPVLPLTIGSAWVPKQGDPVAVMYGTGDRPWVVSPWYPTDKVDSGEIDVPSYEPGELVLGNDSGGTLRIDNDGNIHINSGDGGDVYIDGSKVN